MCFSLRSENVGLSECLLQSLFLFINFTSLISEIHTVVEMLSTLDLDPMYWFEYSELLSYDAYPRLNLH